MKLNKKEFEKLVLKELDTIVKTSDYKKSGWSFYRVINDYFVDISANCYGANNDYSIGCTVGIKPFFFDDVFWEVFKMSSNSNAPLSLRANGAFTFWPLQIYIEL